METKAINLSWLLPDFNNFQVIPHSAEQLSAWFVAVLLAVTVIFFAKSFLSYLHSVNRVSWLTKQLKGLDEESVVRKRTDLVEVAEKKKDTISHLWLEFDETLVEGKKGEALRLFNILDAAHFFNSSTLARGITENRLIAAVPGFLTAIGVIGTFVGLQFGLSELNISSEASVDEMKTGVSSVINGAKIAFLTSVWGVFLSVVFNFFEKLFEQDIRKKISALQNLIDDIFPRMSAEAQLQDISNNSLQSREALQGLAEKIGEKMQESLITATQGIQEGLENSLQKIMAPAINKLVDETSEGNQKVLEDLLGKFMDGFGEQGAEQRLSMEQASSKVNQAVEGMNTIMGAFIKRLEASQLGASKREKELISTISSQVSSLVDHSTNQGKVFTQFLDDNVSKMGEEISSLMTKMDDRDQRALSSEKARSVVIQKQVEQVSRSTHDMLSSIEDSIKQQQSSSRDILNQGHALQKSVESSIHANVEAASAMKESASELRAAADDMNVLSSHIKDAGYKLSGSISQAVESTKELANQNLVGTKRIESLRDELISLTTSIDQMIKNVDQSFVSLKSSQSEFLNEQKSHVSELSKQMATLLSDYAEKANGQTAEHLRVWSESTTQYAQQMNTAARTLSSVVDEIQEKMVE